VERHRTLRLVCHEASDGNRIDILVNFQMEPSPAATPEAENLEAVGIISRMMLLGLYEHIDELIEGYPYEVAVVD